MRNVEYDIADVITDIVSLAIDKGLPRTANILREGYLMVLLESCQSSEADVKRGTKCKLSSII